MTIPSTARKAGPLLGTGAQTAWPFTFKVFAESDISVTTANSTGVETALVLDTDYSVALNANQETSPGGTVTYPISGTALPLGSVLSIVGDLDYDQPLDLPSGGNFSPTALENELDRLTMQIQQLRETIGRSLLVPVTSDAAPALPFPEANQLLGWDATGENLQNVPLSDLATAVAYGTFRYDTFTGDGAETEFALTADPATIANLDVAADGLTMTPGTDYSLVSGMLVLSVAPVLGAWILARYGQAVPITGPVDASAVTYQPAGVGAVATTVDEVLGRTVAVEDYIVAVEANQTQAFVRAATHLLSQANPGGTITVNSNVTVTAGLINFWDILAAEQGITPADAYLPNGQLVRGTKLSVKGWGYDQSRIAVTGAGDAFAWGNFTSISDKRAMSGDVDGIDFVGPGAVGHTSQVIIAGAQGYSTVTNASAGTTNTTTRCLVLHEVVPGTSVTNCRFRYFQEAVHQVYGFGLIADGNDIQYCNIGYFFDAGATTWEVRSGNEIEVCAVGIYSKNTSNGKIGAAVIEANLAGCDVLIWCSKYLSMSGTWFEGSNKNIVVRGDLTAPSLPNSGFAFDNLIGLNIDNNGGIVDFTARKCAMNTLGESFGVNTGEQFENIVYDDCTLNESAFNVASITVSGIATKDKIQIIGATTGGDEASFTMRQPIRKRGITTTNDVAIQPTISVTVPNVTANCRVVIEAMKVDKSGAGYRTQTMRYVGLIPRTAGATADYFNSANETLINNHAASGTTDPTVVATPGVIVAGAVGVEQTVTIRFATGTPAGGSSTTYWDATLYPDIDGVVFA